MHLFSKTIPLIVKAGELIKRKDVNSEGFEQSFALA